MFKIGEFSRFSQVTVKTLRYYDEIGLLKPARVDPFTGYRYYSASQFPRLHRILALKDLQENLKSFEKNLFKTPLVFQYNKRDLARDGIPIIPVEKLEKSLNHQLKVPSFEASALAGINVVETMKKIISLTVSSLEEKLVIKG